MPDAKLAQFADQKYISLETFKKNSQGVKTPVWFVLHENAFYLYTEADSWKRRRSSKAMSGSPRTNCSIESIS